MKSYRISVRSLNNHNENGFIRQSDVRFRIRRFNQLSLICDFCSSDQRFAYSFLQILPRDRHPCCSVMHFTLSGHVRDLHPLERAHGAQTQKRRQQILPSPFLRYYLYISCIFSISNFISSTNSSGANTFTQAP